MSYTNPYLNAEYELLEFSESGDKFTELYTSLEQGLGDYTQLVSQYERTEQQLVAEIDGERRNRLEQELTRLGTDLQQLQGRLTPQLQALLNTAQHDAAQADQAKHLQTKFALLIKRFRTVQLEAKESQREEAARMYRTVKPDASAEEVKEAVQDFDGQQIFQMANAQASRSGQAQAALNEVLQRNRDVQRLERLMQELLTLMNQVEEMVAQQDVQVTQVHQNIKAAHVDVEKGTKNVDQAGVSAKKAWKKKWWIALIVLIIIIIIVLASVCGSGNCKK